MDLLKRLFKGDKVIWIIFLALCMISIIEVFSAASTLTYKSGDHWAPIKEHISFLIAGVILLFILHHISYKWFSKLPMILLPLSLFFLALTTITGFVTGDRVNGAARWSSFMGIPFQPSELGKMAVIITVALILSKKQDENGAAPYAFKYIMIVTGLVCLFIVPENLSTSLLLFGVVYLMMFIGRVSKKTMIYFTSGIAILGVLGIATLIAVPSNSDIPFLHRMGTWKSRVVNFIYPEEVPAAKYDIDKNAQVAHARISIATSNVVGKGPGNSVQRDFLSQAFSDFIFAIIIEELGLIGGGAVVILYVWLLMRAGRIARKCDRTFPVLLVMGIALLLTSQAILNMMVAVGLFPVTGQPLPLISKGGTSTIINCAYIGMILSVSRYANTLEELNEQRTPEALEEMEAIQASEPVTEAFDTEL